MKACVLKEFGVYDNLILKDIPSVGKTLEPTEVLLKHEAIGINYDDVMYRKNLLKMPSFVPKDGKGLVLGFEGVGRVLKIGEAVKGLKIGDLAGYAFSDFGAYSQERVIDQGYLLKIPDDIPSDIAAAILRKGLMAESLLFKLFQAKEGEWILIHSVAGGVGHILAKWARYLKLNVIGTVGDSTKVSTALAAGCKHVINRKENPKFFEQVYETTEHKGVRAVFDGIGQPVYIESLKSLQYFGIYVSYGYAGGIIESVDPMMIRSKSLVFSTPSLELMKGNRYELILSAGEVFDMFKKGVISPNLSRYTMDGIPQAHADLESGATIGSIVVNVY